MSDLFKNKYRISSARLQTWNYADNSLYFITICTKDRECFFGDIVETRCSASLADMPENKMQLNDLGKKVESEWLKTIELRPDMNLELAEYVVMPNHFHGIIFIGENKYNNDYPKYMAGDVMHHVSTNGIVDDSPKNKFGNQSKNLASIIGGFKAAVTTYARKNNIPFAWQARFYDHIITSNEEYLKIADYILYNPNNWQKDKFYK
ncbi:transposase [Mucilaginibacter gotjawali]|uniref:REP element-mobilizing transposase RayT n=2 Tax=Mucilaginibacter gotjawali TaxID=1550579 RepID=A0A839SLW9_9SPHI|nr:transposase [Mucilaginibacter gotjawali]MBB3057437.1 REP element-mobilizing transposase RayT [Mucilaginibacter gotjawali]BAU55443.1 hypothetical protein MgSA37_03632 [Mucilaginibacter gotjawali]